MTRKFIQLQEQYIAGAGASIGDTSIILKSFKKIDGTDITDMATVFGNKAYATIEPGKGTREEQISFTGITTNADNTVSLTGVSSIDMAYPYTETPGLTKQHAGGVAFVISNTSGFYSEFIIAGDDYDIEGEFIFKTQPKINIDISPIDGNPDDPVEPEDIPTKYYVDKEIDSKLSKTGGEMSGVISMGDNAITGVETPGASDLDFVANVEYVNSVAISGAPDASTVGKGLVEEATQAEADEGIDTGSTGAKLFVPPSKIPQPIWKETKTYVEGDIVWHERKTWVSDSNSNSNHEPGGTDTFESPYEINMPVDTGDDVTLYSHGCFANSGIYYFQRVSTNQVERKTLDSAYDLRSQISTTTYTHNAVALNTAKGGIEISPDGTKMFILAYDGSYDTLFQFSTTTAYDFSSSNYDGSGHVIYSGNETYDFAFNGDGTKVYLANYNADRIYERDCISAWNVVGMNETYGTAVFLGGVIEPTRIQFLNNGEKVFISGKDTTANDFGGRLYELSTPYDFSTISTGYVSVPYDINYRYQIISDDGKFLYQPYDNTSRSIYKFGKLYWSGSISIGEHELIGEDTGNNALSISYGVTETGFVYGWVEYTGQQTFCYYTPAGGTTISIAQSSGDIIPFCIPVSKGDLVELISQDGNGGLYFKTIN